jgi:hypothetical protein
MDDDQKIIQVLLDLKGLVSLLYSVEGLSSGESVAVNVDTFEACTACGIRYARRACTALLMDELNVDMDVDENVFCVLSGMLIVNAVHVAGLMTILPVQSVTTALTDLADRLQVALGKLQVDDYKYLLELTDVDIALRSVLVLALNLGRKWEGIDLDAIPIENILGKKV